MANESKRETGSYSEQGSFTYLASRRRREPLSYYADEIGLAWNVLLAAWRGHEHPYSYAFIRKYGKSPEKLIPMWAKREEELLKWLDGEHHIAPCSCAECELKRSNMGLAVQMSLNLPKTVPFPAAASTRDDGSLGGQSNRATASQSGPQVISSGEWRDKLAPAESVATTSPVTVGPRRSSDRSEADAGKPHNTRDPHSPDSRLSPQPETPTAKKATA